MSDERWVRIDRLLQSALSRPAHEREAFLRDACKDDQAVRDEVLSLLAHEGSAEKFLEHAPAPDRQPFKPGTRLGAYEVRAQIGEGGMGEVYRAHDSRLRRDIALKILPPEAADAERRQRFTREAQAVAALNHPGIVTIHSVEEAPSIGSGQPTIHFLTMELVEGEALDARLRRGPLPLEEVIAISRQLVDALEVAHERGIIHRDLKPANIMVTSDGVVKILDFGLAKALNPDPESGEAANSPTITAIAGTEAGVILGTAAYMSPEQARGRPVDKRTDVWAFGCVLYELLTGKRAFRGDTVTDTLAAVIAGKPDWSALPDTAPSAIVRLLRRCLEPDQKKRLRDISVARLELDEAGRPDTAPAGASTGRRRGLVVLPWVLAAAAMVALALVFWLRPKPVEWIGRQLGATPIAMKPRISPDGKSVAFLAMVEEQTQLAVIESDGRNSIVYTTDRAHGSINNLCWSRDGKRIYFDRDFPTNSVYSVPINGRDQVKLEIPEGSAPQVLWDGSLLVRRRDAENRFQLYRVGLDTNRIDQPVGAVVRSGAQFRSSPDGRQIAFVGRPLTPQVSEDDIYLLNLESRVFKKIASRELRANVGAFDTDGKSVLLTPNPSSGSAAGDSRRIVRVPLDGSGTPETILTLASYPGSVDVGLDGSMYFSQVTPQIEIFRVKAPGRDSNIVGSERVVTFPFTLWRDFFLPLPDGRLLISPGRIDYSLVVVSGDREDGRLPDSSVKAFAPAALLGDTELVHMVEGEKVGQDLVVSSLQKRAIVRRFEEVKGKRDSFNSIAVSPDQKTIYYTDDGTIYSIPSGGGTPTQIGKGNSIVMDSVRRQLIVHITDKDGTRLVRRPLDGSPERPVRITDPYRFAESNGNPQAVDKSGRIIWPIARPDSWFYPIGVVDPDTGDVKVVKTTYPADLHGAWTADGRILFSAFASQSTLWRFTPQKK